MGNGSHPIRQPRTWLLIALVIGVAALTGAMLVLGRALSERFASQIQADLEWRALRGARELSKTTELDGALIDEALGAYAASPDVQAIAVEVGNRVVASHETSASIAPVFAAQPGTLVRGDGYVASWAAVKGTQVGKIAMVVSTRRLADAHAMRAEVSRLTLIAGAIAALLGALVVLVLTRRNHAPGATDPPGEVGHALAPPAPELAPRDRTLRMILDHAAQGFLTVELDGRITGERSAASDRWLGEPGPDATLPGYLSVYSDELADQLRAGLQALRAGTVPLAHCLAQLPTRLVAIANTFDLAYAPVLGGEHGEKPERLLVIVTDVSEQAARERALREQHEQREQREMVSLSQLITVDRAAFDEFFAEAAGLVASLEAPADPELELRTLRTLKDNCAYYGLDTYVELCQRIEASLAETDGVISDARRVELANGWGRIASQLVVLLK